MHDMLMERVDIKDSKKAVIFEKIAEIDNNLMEGADEYLQLLDLAVTLMRQWVNKTNEMKSYLLSRIFCIQ